MKGKMGTLEELQKSIEQADLNAFLITDTKNAYYFTDFFSMSYAYLLVYPGDNAFLFVPELEYEEAHNKVKNCIIRKVDRNQELLKMIQQNLEIKQVKELGFEESTMTVDFYLTLLEKFDFLNLKKGSKIIDELRIRKNREEIDKIIRACKIADKGMITAMDKIEEGVTEIDVALEAEYVMRKEGSEAAPFETIVASGNRSALPHGISSDKKIERGDYVIIDLGAKYEGYCSDITRTITVGAPTEKQMAIFKSVLKTQRTVIEECKIGKNASEMDQLARKLFAEEKLEEYFVHSLGHGVGLDVHEFPVLASKSKDIILENSVFTVEPGIYIPNFGGVRIEDVIQVTKNGPKYLTTSKYDLH